VKLSAEQLAAVTRTGQDVCVVAGPGSGKTRVLVERFRWRIQNGCSPLRILAVTFTDKAATEIKQRLAKDFSAQPELKEQLERAHVSTVHGFCARLLREHAIDAGLDPRFEVLERPESGALLRAAAEETLDALFAERPAEMRALLAAVDFSEPAQELARAYEARRLLHAAARGAAADDPYQRLREPLEAIVTGVSQGWNPSQQAECARVQAWARRLLELPADRVGLEHFRALAAFDCDLRRLKRNNPLYEEIKLVKQELLVKAHQALLAQYYAPQRALLEESLDGLEARYRQRKQALGALDFADLEEHAIRLLESDAQLRERVRQNFDEILMDEFQDTNPLQAALIALLRRPGRFFAVGDVNQSIYGFRHAEPEVFAGYRRELEAQGLAVDWLRENHRSRGEVLKAVETILADAPGIEPHELAARREFPEKRGPSVEVISAVGATTEEAAALEAQWVARRIREMVDAGRVRFRDIAVLVRNVNALIPFAEAFHDFDVPYVIARGKGFFETQEVADLTGWLRVLVNPRDEIALAGLLRSPLVGVSDETLLRLTGQGRLADAFARLDDCRGLDAGDRERVLWVRGLLEAQRAQADETPPDRLLARLLDASGYEDALSPRARANVRRFLELVRDWFSRRPRPLFELVEELADRRAADPDEAAPPAEGALSAVQVMTMHAAKGLEFPVVFAAALHKGVAGDSPPLAFSPASGLVARWRDPITGQGTKDLAYSAFSEELARKEEEEGHRLFYVAMTRAIEHLVLSFAATLKSVRNWARTVVERLGLDLAEAYTEAPERPAPRALEIVEERAPRLARPVLTGQHDSSVSVTDVMLHAQCPRKYFLARYLGLSAMQTPAEPRPSEGVKKSAGRRNRLPHDGLSALVAPWGRPFGLPPAPPNRFLHTFSGSGPRDDTGPDAAELGSQVHDLLAGLEVPDPAPEALELAARFQASDLARRAASATRLERESGFLIEMEEMVLNGRIDLWFEEGGELLLVDYKTDDVSAEEAAAHARSYALQLRLYALAVERIAGRLPDRALLCLLRPQVEVPVSLLPEDLEAARAAVRALRQAQQDIRFPLRPGAHCQRCSYFAGLCPAQA